MRLMQVRYTLHADPPFPSLPTHDVQPEKAFCVLLKRVGSLGSVVAAAISLVEGIGRGWVVGLGSVVLFLNVDGVVAWLPE